MNRLTALAKELFEADWSVEEVRRELRQTLLGDEFPTCSAVEEAVGNAMKAVRV